MENQNIQIIEEDTIDILDLIKMLWKKLPVLIASLLVGAVLAGCYTVFFVTPMYKASSMIYVYSKTTSITSLADLQIGSQLTVDFQIIASTRDVVEAAAKDVGITDPYEVVVKKISVTNPQNSRILTITVTDSDPEIATRLCNALSYQLRLRIAEVMNSDVPSSVERAVTPVNPASPSLTKNVALGGVGLFVLVAAIYVVAYLLDDTIKSEEDVEKYLRQNVIAVIPVISDSGKKGFGLLGSKVKSAKT